MNKFLKGLLISIPIVMILASVALMIMGIIANYYGNGKASELFVSLAILDAFVVFFGTLFIAAIFVD